LYLPVVDPCFSAFQRRRGGVDPHKVDRGSTAAVRKWSEASMQHPQRRIGPSKLPTGNSGITAASTQDTKFRYIDLMLNKIANSQTST
jgi:hypothetical protein